MEAELPNFWEQDFASGYPAAYLPFQKSLPPGCKAVCISEAGYMADPFGCQHPKMTKLTKNETPVLEVQKPRRAGDFHPATPVTVMWEEVEKMQGTRVAIHTGLPETCRICV